MINFLQISDPHFGAIFSNTDEHWLHSSLNSHDYNLCLALARFVNFDLAKLDGVAASDELFIIMNGDLTAKGSKEQFIVANTFLFSQHAVPSEGWLQKVGLAHQQRSSDGSKDLYADVPGNHDHGDGRWLFPVVKGFASDVYKSLICIPPYVRRFQSSEGIEVCVFGVDSCTIFVDAPPNINPLAEGGFSGEHMQEFVDLLRVELSKPVPKDCHLRTAVIVCHHPFREDGYAGPLYPHSGEWLAQTAARFGIRMIFTGHTHRSSTESIRFTDFHGIEQRVREVRCPTTLQWPAKLHEGDRSPGLWLHQISADGNNVVWQGSQMLYSGTSFMTFGRNMPAKKKERVGWYREEIPHIEPVSDAWLDEFEDSDVDS